MRECIVPKGPTVIRDGDVVTIQGEATIEVGSLTVNVVAHPAWATRFAELREELRALRAVVRRNDLFAFTVTTITNVTIILILLAIR